MGIMTATQFADALRLDMGQRNSTDLPNSVVERNLNWALYHVSNPQLYDHYELRDTTTQALVTGTDTYLIEAATSVRTMALRSVVIFDPANPQQRRRLRLRDDRELHEHWRPNGYPTWYHTAWTGQDAITMLPAPSAQYNGWTLSIRRWKSPTAFNLTSGGGSTTPLHYQWDEVILQGAIWRTWRHLKEYEKAELAKAEFATLGREIVNRAQRDAEDRDYGPEVMIDDAMDYGVGD